ncbi:MAG: lipopolysaccharide biosynthesis protein [Oceanospirillaceae bacterium]|nr:lipopolysaccharide biosynthesis protein [Oceanospirillaceae bacterium]
MNDYQKFIKQVSTVLTGAFLAQIIMLVAAPLITRIYSPDEFGLVAAFWATGSIIGIVACLRYETTIILENNKDDNTQLVFACILITIVMATLTSIVIVASYWTFPDDYNLLSKDINLGLPFVVLMLGFSKIADCILTKNKRFLYLAIIAIGSVIVSSSYKILVGYFLSSSYYNLMIGNFIALLFAPIVLFVYLLKLEFKKIEWPRIMVLLRKYKKFPLIHAPNGFFNTLSSNLPLIIIAGMHGSEMAGYYAIALLVIQRPTIMFGGAVAKVFLQRAANSKEKDLYNDIQKATLFLVLIGFPPFLIFSYISVDIFTIFFGSAWGQAGEISRLLVPWLFCAFINTPVVQGLVASGKLEVILFYNISNILRCIVFYLLIDGGYDFKMSVLTYSVFGCVTILCLIIYTLNILKPKIKINMN